MEIFHSSLDVISTIHKLSFICILDCVNSASPLRVKSCVVDDNFLLFVFAFVKN